MTISTLLMILALAVGSESPTNSGIRPPGKIQGNCWINGVWYNPCPSQDEAPQPSPMPGPQMQPPI